MDRERVVAKAAASLLSAAVILAAPGVERVFAEGRIVRAPVGNGPTTWGAFLQPELGGALPSRLESRAGANWLSGWAFRTRVWTRRDRLWEQSVLRALPEDVSPAGLSQEEQIGYLNSAFSKTETVMGQIEGVTGPEWLDQPPRPGEEAWATASHVLEVIEASRRLERAAPRTWRSIDDSLARLAASFRSRLNRSYTSPPVGPVAPPRPYNGVAPGAKSQPAPDPVDVQLGVRTASTHEAPVSKETDVAGRAAWKALTKIVQDYRDDPKRLRIFLKHPEPDLAKWIAKRGLKLTPGTHFGPQGYIIDPMPEVLARNAKQAQALAVELAFLPYIDHISVHEDVDRRLRSPEGRRGWVRYAIAHPDAADSIAASVPSWFSNAPLDRMRRLAEKATIGGRSVRAPAKRSPSHDAAVLGLLMMLGGMSSLPVGLIGVGLSSTLGAPSILGMIGIGAIIVAIAHAIWGDRRKGPRGEIPDRNVGLAFFSGLAAGALGLALGALLGR